MAQNLWPRTDTTQWPLPPPPPPFPSSDRRSSAVGVQLWHAPRLHASLHPSFLLLYSEVRIRRGSTPLTVSASLKEKIGGIQKTWSHLSSLNYCVVKDYYKLVNSVNAFEPHIEKLSDEQLSAKTVEFRRRLREGETPASIQAEAFAVVREAAKRKLGFGMCHFDVQEEPCFMMGASRK